MKKLKISIITVSYNSQNTIKTTLDSINNQEYNNNRINNNRTNN